MLPVLSPADDHHVWADEGAALMSTPSTSVASLTCFVSPRQHCGQHLAHLQLHLCDVCHCVPLSFATLYKSDPRDRKQYVTSRPRPLLG